MTPVFATMPTLRRADRNARYAKMAEEIAAATNEELREINACLTISDIELVEISETDGDRLHFLRVGGDAPRAWREHA